MHRAPLVGFKREISPHLGELPLVFRVTAAVSAARLVVALPETDVPDFLLGVLLVGFSRRLTAPDLLTAANEISYSRISAPRPAPQPR